MARVDSALYHQKGGGLFRILGETSVNAPTGGMVTTRMTLASRSAKVGDFGVAGVVGVVEVMNLSFPKRGSRSNRQKNLPILL